MSEQIGLVKEWLGKKSEAVFQVGMDDDLIDSRIIDSLSFMEFIFFLEEITGKADLLETATVDSFRTLGAIERTFLQA